jgi:hypothetical protein
VGGGECGQRVILSHAEWSQIFNTISLADNQEKVVKLFNRFNYNIQTKLYRKELDPEDSTWDQVVKGTEQAEILVKIEEKNRQAMSEPKYQAQEVED